MAADLWGNAVSDGSPAALAAIDDFAGGLVAYETRAANILAAAEADASHPLVAIWAGVLNLLGEHEGAAEAARPWLAAAEAGLDRANPRERHHFVALRAWIDGNIEETILELETLVAAHPHDLTALKLLHYHLFNRGDFPGLLRTATLAVAAAPEIAYVHGMAAFGYEQLHLLDEAEAAARRALAIEPREPWAQHALAHVMLTQGRIDEGIDFLEAARAGWAGLNSFMLTHLWWHLALFYLSAGREAEALAAYDEQVWAVAKDYSQDQIGAVSLLARLEIDGVPVGKRWKELARHLAARKTDVLQSFLSVQYLYGLARADRGEADTLLDAIAAAAADPGRQDRAVWQQVALPLAQGLVAHARGAHAAAAELLADVLPRLIRIGGSHAQRDLFEIILLDARIRSGDFVEAQQMLALRRAHDPEGVPLNRSLAAVYRALGLPELADAADARVRARLH